MLPGSTEPTNNINTRISNHRPVFMHDLGLCVWVRMHGQNCVLYILLMPKKHYTRKKKHYTRKKKYVENPKPKRKQKTF